MYRLSGIYVTQAWSMVFLYMIMIFKIAKEKKHGQVRSQQSLEFW